MRRALLAMAVVLLVPPAGASAAEVYKWSYELRSFSHSKSVCGGRNGPGRVFTEVVTQEIFSRSSGVSHVGNGRSLPRGSSTSSGRRRYTYSKKQEDPDGTVLHEDGTVSESMPLIAANWGGVNGKKNGKRTLDVAFLDDPTQPFTKLRKKQTITIPINESSPTQQSDDGHCATEHTGTVTGSITITRVS